MRPERLLLTAASLLLFACAASPGIETTLSLGDSSEFEQKVQPLLVARCGSGGCHGRADRPFHLYAPGALRQDVDATFLDTPLTAAETQENLYRAAGFAQSCKPPACLLTCKPLSPGAGGCAHGGGVSFDDLRDPDYRLLASWLAPPQLADGGAP